ENLMLLCAPCHKLIDDRPADYPRSVLEAYKRDHERRISHVTGLVPDLRTTVVHLERFPLGLNRDSQWARKCGVSADDSVSGMRFAAVSDSSCDGCPPKPAPNSSHMQDMLQHDRNPL